MGWIHKTKTFVSRNNSFRPLLPEKTGAVCMKLFMKNSRLKKFYESGPWSCRPFKRTGANEGWSASAGESLVMTVILFCLPNLEP